MIKRDRDLVTIEEINERIKSIKNQIEKEENKEIPIYIDLSKKRHERIKKLNERIDRLAYAKYLILSKK